MFLWWRQNASGSISVFEFLTASDFTRQAFSHWDFRGNTTYFFIYFNKELITLLSGIPFECKNFESKVIEQVLNFWERDKKNSKSLVSLPIFLLFYFLPLFPPTYFYCLVPCDFSIVPWRNERNFISRLQTCLKQFAVLWGFTSAILSTIFLITARDQKKWNFLFDMPNFLLPKVQFARGNLSTLWRSSVLS